jgi:hypothetical protein
VNKYICSILRENQVRLAWQRLVMKFIPKTFCEQKLSDEDFRLGVLAPDPRHIVTSGFFIINICHFKTIYTLLLDFSTI